MLKQTIQAYLAAARSLGFSNVMISGGLLYGILNWLVALFVGEPSLQFAFNSCYSIAAICIGLWSKARGHQRTVKL